MNLRTERLWKKGLKRLINAIDKSNSTFAQDWEIKKKKGPNMKNEEKMWDYVLLSEHIPI